MHDKQAWYSISASQHVFVDCMCENGCCSADSAQDVAEEKIWQALAYLTDEVCAGNRPNVAHASRLFGCPLTTLHCRWKGGRRSLKEANEAKQLLSPAQEAALVLWLEMLGDEGTPICKCTVRKRVEVICGKRPSRNWIYDKHPRLHESPVYSPLFNPSHCGGAQVQQAGAIPTPLTASTSQQHANSLRQPLGNSFLTNVTLSHSLFHILHISLPSYSQFNLLPQQPLAPPQLDLQHNNSTTIPPHLNSQYPHYFNSL